MFFILKISLNTWVTIPDISNHLFPQDANPQRFKTEMMLFNHIIIKSYYYKSYSAFGPLCATPVAILGGSLQKSLDFRLLHLHINRVAWNVKCTVVKQRRHFLNTGKFRFAWPIQDLWSAYIILGMFCIFELVAEAWDSTLQI